jgi:hypothetical protein
VGDLQAWPWPQLLGVVGGQRKLAGRLWEWCWGRDVAPVADKGPPKSIQVRGRVQLQPRGGQALQGAVRRALQVCCGWHRPCLVACTFQQLLQRRFGGVPAGGLKP